MTEDTKPEETLPDPTGKALLFAMEYLVDRNATKAAKRAGYSEATAYSQGHRLLKNVEVAAYIRRESEKRYAELHMGAGEVMAEIAKVARFNIQDITTITRDGDPYIDLSLADRDTLAAIGQMSIKDVVEGRGDDARTVREVKVTPFNKLDALKTIAQHHGLLKERHVVEVDEGLAEMLMKGRRRAAEK